MDLTGRSAIITGGSQGFGFEVAKQFILAGANVMLCARDSNKLLRAKEALLPFVKSAVKIAIFPADVAKITEMDMLFQSALAEFGKIDILVANAGIHGSKGPIEAIDWEEWSAAIDINLKGTAWQCRAVLPHFKQNRYGKIIILSGGGATKPMPYLSAYAASKAGVVRLAETFAVELKNFNIDVNCVAPGALNTRLLQDILQAGPEKVGESYYLQALKQKAEGGESLTTGAMLCTFLASSESDGITGKLISAIWDPWKKLSDYRKELQDSDVYTLRRIIPKDRGYNWDEEQ